MPEFTFPVRVGSLSCPSGPTICALGGREGSEEREAETGRHMSFNIGGVSRGGQRHAGRQAETGLSIQLVLVEVQTV